MRKGKGEAMKSNMSYTVKHHKRLIRDAETLRLIVKHRMDVRCIQGARIFEWDAQRRTPGSTSFGAGKTIHTAVRKAAKGGK